MSEQIEGRNAVLEAFRSGKCVDKLFVLDRCQDGPVRTIIREARKKDTIINFVQKERLDQLSETGSPSGRDREVAAYEYSTVEDILNKAKEKGEAPFIFYFLMISKIPIIWELLSVLPTLQAHMVLSFRKDMRQGLHQQLQKLLQGL